VGPHVLLLSAAQGWRVLHAALLTLTAVHVGPQEPVALLQRLADRVLAWSRAERDHRAHHLVAEHDRQLCRRQRLGHPVPLVDVRAADRGDVHAYEQGTALELVFARHRQLADLRIVGKDERPDDGPQAATSRNSRRVAAWSGPPRYLGVSARWCIVRGTAMPETRTARAPVGAARAPSRRARARQSRFARVRSIFRFLQRLWLVFLAVPLAVRIIVATVV